MRRNLFGGDEYFAAFLLAADRRNRLNLAALTLLDARPIGVPSHIWEHAVRDALLVAWVAIVKSDIEPSIGELVEGAERVLRTHRGARDAWDEREQDAARSAGVPGASTIQHGGEG